ncbi:MAG: hypothetical protein IJM91_03795 [Lachnospiraceae bacterium]|nr:hypothetical protein [Lachnospiraceae bacterium]
MRIVSFGMCSMLLLVVMIKMLLVIGVPYVREEELVYAGELSTRKAITMFADGFNGDKQRFLKEETERVMAGEGEIVIENFYYNGKECSISVDYVLKFTLINGTEKIIRVRRKAGVIE